MKTRSKINNWDTIRTGQSKLLPIQDCAVPCLVTQSRPILLWFQGLQPTKLLCPWGFSRQEYWNGLPCPPPEDCPNTGIKPRSPALQADCLPSEPPKFSLSLDKRMYFFTSGVTRYGNGFLHLNTWVLKELDLACNEKPTYFYSHLYICFVV